jgi:transcription antitermination factor NusG
VVHFGSQWPTVPVTAIEELRRTLGPDELHVVSDELSPGDQVRIATGPFEGLAAVVTHALPGRQRVAVLLEFLGRQTKVELPPESLLKQADPRQLDSGD